MFYTNEEHLFFLFLLFLLFLLSSTYVQFFFQNKNTHATEKKDTSTTSCYLTSLRAWFIGNRHKCRVIITIFYIFKIISTLYFFHLTCKYKIQIGLVKIFFIPHSFNTSFLLLLLFFLVFLIVSGLFKPEVFSLI